MGSLHPSDADLHFSDCSHRWYDPFSPAGDEAWRARVEAHIEEHRRMEFGPGERPGRSVA